MKKLRSLPVDVRLCPDMIGFHLPHRQVTHTRLTKQQASRTTKRRRRSSNDQP